MRGKALQTVAVGFPYHPAQRQHFKDPFFLALLGSIGDALIDSGHSMLVVAVEADRFSSITQPYETGQVLGTILLGQDEHHQRMNEMAIRGMPVMVWGAHLGDQLYATVGSDNQHGGQLATGHLLAQGARRIAFLGDRRLPEIGHRYEGYLAAHMACGVPVAAGLERAVPFTTAEIRAELNRMLDQRLDFDAIVATGDLMALTAIDVLQSRGLRVPDDVLVVGFDDLPQAATARPALTTVRQAVEEGGRQLVQRLLAKLAGEPVGSLVMPVELVVRASTQRSTSRST